MLCVSDYGFYKLECKTKTNAGVEFTTSGNSNHDTNKVNGSLETKYKWSDYGEYPQGWFGSLPVIVILLPADYTSTTEYQHHVHKI